MKFKAGDMARRVVNGELRTWTVAETCEGERMFGQWLMFVEDKDYPDGKPRWWLASGWTR